MPKKSWGSAAQKRAQQKAAEASARKRRRSLSEILAARKSRAGGSLSVAIKSAAKISKEHDLSGHNRSEANKAAYRASGAEAKKLKVDGSGPTADRVYSTAKRLQAGKFTGKSRKPNRIALGDTQPAKPRPAAKAASPARKSTAGRESIQTLAKRSQNSPNTKGPKQELSAAQKADDAWSAAYSKMSPAQKKTYDNIVMGGGRTDEAGLRDKLRTMRAGPVKDAVLAKANKMQAQRIEQEDKRRIILAQHQRNQAASSKSGGAASPTEIRGLVKSYGGSTAQVVTDQETGDVHLVFQDKPSDFDGLKKQYQKAGFDVVEDDPRSAPHPKWILKKKKR